MSDAEIKTFARQEQAMSKSKRSEQAPTDEAPDLEQISQAEPTDGEPDAESSNGNGHTVQTVTRRKRQPARDPNLPPETKAERFRRLANKRGLAARKRIAQVANLASRSSYEYTEEQADKLKAGIIDAVNKLIAAFDAKITTGDAWSL